MHNNKFKLSFVLDDIRCGGSQKLTLDVINLLDDNIFEKNLVLLNSIDPQDNLLSILSDKINIINLEFNRSANIFEKLTRLYSAVNESDLIHTSSSNSNLYCSLIRFTLPDEKKIICTVHGEDGYYIDDPLLNRMKKSFGFIYYLKEKYMLNIFIRRLDKFIAVCDFVKEYLRKIRKIKYDKIKTVIHGLNINDLNQNADFNLRDFKMKSGLNEDDFVLTYIGRLTYAKGLEYLVDKFSIFSRNKPGVKLLFIGDGEIKELLMKKVYDYGISDKCKFFGFTNVVRNYYLITDMFILPSFSESTNLGLQQAMFFENLVLSSDAGGLKEIVDDNYNGILFKKGDFSDMLAKMDYIYENYENLDHIRKNAKLKILSNFDLSKNVLDIQKVILNMLNRVNN